MLALAKSIIDLDAAIQAKLDPATALAFQSLLSIPARASANLVQMQLNAAKNEHSAKQGKPLANEYAEKVSAAIAADKAIIKEIATFAKGKWSGHELEHHVGFRTWNDDGARYPVRQIVESISEPRMVVSRADSDEIAFKAYFKPMQIIVDDFLFDVEQVQLEIANDGVGNFEFEITGGEDLGWLSVNPRRATVSTQNNVELRVDKSKLNSEAETVVLRIAGATAVVEVIVSASNSDAPRDNVHVIPASNWASSSLGANGEQWTVIPKGGRDGDAIRVMPTTSSFTHTSTAPTVTYQVNIAEPGTYVIETWQVPTGSVVRGEPLEYTVTTTNGTQTVTAVASDVDAGNPADPRWAEPALDNIRKTQTVVDLPKGLSEISIGAIQPNLMLEKILIYPQGYPPKPSYLGPLR
jgi:hypothetical protein